MNIKKFISILLVLVFILNMAEYSLATNKITTGIEGNSEINNINEDTNNIENINDINLNTNSIEDLNNQKSDITEKIDGATLELEYVKTEITDTIAKIQELDDRIRGYESENNELAEKLNTLEISVKETTEKLNTVTDEYVKKEKLLRNRLVALYEAGSVSYLDVLLSASSLSDFLSRYYKMLEIMEYDNQLIATVEEEKDIIETSKQKLEKETAEYKNLKLKSEQSEIIYKNIKTLQEEYIKQLSNSEKELNNKITKYKTEAIQIETRIREISGESGEYSIQYTGGLMIWPIAKTGTGITSDYGNREHPIQGITNFHLGIDIGNTGFGAPVVAALGGVVIYAGELGSYGNCVIINHGNGISTLYGHGQMVLTEYGKTVEQGDIIMQTGSTGNSTGPHLHFEVRVNGTTVDPLKYVNIP